MSCRVTLFAGPGRYNRARLVTKRMLFHPCSLPSGKFPVIPKQPWGTAGRDMCAACCMKASTNSEVNLIMILKTPRFFIAATCSSNCRSVHKSLAEPVGASKSPPCLFPAANQTCGSRVCAAKKRVACIIRGYFCSSFLDCCWVV